MVHTPSESKRAPRVDLRRPAFLINADGVQIGVVILDVSSGGFRLEVADHLRIGERVSLRVEHHDEFPAQIRWVLGMEAGGVFLAPVDYVALQMSAGEAAMAEAGNDTNCRRGDERRQSERREGGNRRQGSRKSDRRESERRQDDRRS